MFVQKNADLLKRCLMISCVIISLLYDYTRGATCLWRVLFMSCWKKKPESIKMDSYFLFSSSFKKKFSQKAPNKKTRTFVLVFLICTRDGTTTMI